MLTLEKLLEESKHSIGICNSCRYCEGFCAVFPAMEKRLDFTTVDMHYLANLCHNCSECYYACQFAPPHEFQVNIPQQFAQLRLSTYTEYAWPKGIAKLFAKNGLIATLIFVFTLITLFFGANIFNSTDPVSGDFYSIFPHNFLVIVFGTAFVWMLVAILMGFKNYLKDIEPNPTSLFTSANIKQALSDALSMKYLHGNIKTGCTYPDDNISPWRRYFHHFTFYGFMLCFAATVSGTFMHYVLGMAAPYPFFSVPKILGTIGGISLTIGTAGLFILKTKADENIKDIRQMGMDYAFIALLFLIAISGLALMIWRETYAMPSLLVIHLSLILALFVTMPFGKFVHAFYRFGALLKYAKESKEDA